jgi:hypothetical protein
MLPQEELIRLRQEMRELRRRTSRSETSIEERDRKIAHLEEAVRNLTQDKKKLEADKEDLEEEIASLKAHQVKLQSMLFKANVPVQVPAKVEVALERRRGGQTGHRGCARMQPQDIDADKAVFLTHCPECEHVLNESNLTYTRTVQDIPEARAMTTRYLIQRQWCAHCQREVHAIPRDTLPGMRVGLRTVVLICFLKYRLRTPLAKIRELLLSQHGLRLTEGGIQKILHLLSQKFMPACDQILKEIRAAPMKHADETSWRIQGQNSWCWLFATPKAALYTIEESRGKGVPQRILGPDPQGVLVRDDYPGYDCLRTMRHQSCWAHLLSVAHEAKEQPTASKEMRLLHEELKTLFGKLQSMIQIPFCKQERRRAYTEYAKQIHSIVKRVHIAKDASKIQTRIKNQTTNLLTALLYENGPLTNNHAERQIRPMTVTRKLAGGSQSPKGATIHAVNMSVMQTIALKGQGYLEELRRTLTQSSQRWVLEKGE